MNPPPRARRPAARTLLLFLLLLGAAGAAVNVAVAWECAMCLNMDMYQRDNPVESEWAEAHDVTWRGQALSKWCVWRHQRAGGLIITSWRSVDPLESGTSTAITPEQLTPRFLANSLTAIQANDGHIATAWGWPCVCLWSDYVGPAGILSDGIAVRGAGLTFGAFGAPLPRSVPFGIIWPGFAINTIFYAPICALLFAAPFAVRRRRRIKCGLCPACAYPLGTSDLCTECGTPVPAPRPVTALRSHDSA